ncbi:glycerophosphodiester phosphodiesterase [Candidatus Woesearchaeota archaeon]|nr:glycerophosphodiester phosphodiesterase [Candidatus Woesearchaeota archaeon]
MIKKKRQYQIISHRGRGFGERENTKSALQEALASGVDAVEIDVRSTKDNKLVIWHDKTVRSKRGKKLKLDEISLAKAELNGLMSLKHALRTFKKDSSAHQELQLDLKEIGHEEEIIRLIRRTHVKKVLIISWVPSVLKKFYKLAPEIPLSLSFTPKMRTILRNDTPIWPALRLPAIIRKREVPLRSANLVPIALPLSASIVWRLLAFGVEPIIVNADSIYQNEKYRYIGVAGTMTNEPEDLLKHYKKKN